MQKKSKTQSLQARITELEQQLAEAQATILSLKAENTPASSHKPPKAGGNISFASDEGFKQALLIAPYPLMIWREDGIVMMVNAAFTQISGYTVEDITTIEEWSHKAFADRFLEQPSLLFYEELPGEDIKKSREFEITTRSGGRRIWDFSYAALGTDEQGRWLMIAMAVDITERREIEEQLQENERKFTVIFDKAPFAAALSKLPDGRVTHINDEYERLLGYTRQEVLGKTSLEIGINPDEEGRNRILAQIQAHGNARDIEVRLHTKSGDVRICLLNLDRVSIEGQQYILQTAQDITDRKRAEKALEDSEERFSKAFHKSPFGMNITRSSDGAILDVNDAWLNLLGWTRGEILGKTTAEFPFYAQPEDRQTVRDRITKDEVPGDMELHLVRKDGTELVTIVATTIIDLQGERCILGVLNDITERKRAEQALQESELKYSLLFGKSAIPIVLLKLPEVTIIDVNEALEKLVGYTQQEMYGRTTVELGIARPEVRKQSIEKFDMQGSLQGDETQIFTKTGEERIVSIATNRLEFGGKRYAISTMQDITERKRAETALRQSEERFSKAFHSSPDATAISRFSDGLMIDMNDVWSGLFGYSRNEAIGHTSTELSLIAEPQYRQEVLHRMQEEGSIHNFELPIRRKSGELRLVALSSEKIQVNGEDALLSVMRDITEQKKVEQALRESEERYRAVIENAVDAIIVTDPSHEGRIISANPAACQMFGYSLEEFKGLNREDMIDLSDSRVGNFLRRRDLPGQGAGELTYIRRDGTRFPGELTSASFKNQDGQQNAIVIIRDVTERRKVEMALQESEQRYRRLFESMQEGLIAGEVITDEHGHPVDYRYIDVNPATERQYDIPRERFIGRTYTDVLPKGDPAWIQILGNVALTGEPDSVERYSQVSGKWFEAHAYSPQPGQFVNILTDITERKKAEEALKASEAKMRAVFRALTEGVVFFNREGIVEEANEAVEFSFQQTIDELSDPEQEPRTRIIRPDGSLFPVEERPAMHALRTGETVRNVEMGIPLKDGRLSWQLVNAQPVMDDDGNLLGAVASFFDITERRKVEQALRESEERSRSLADSMPQLVWTALPDGRVDYYNKRRLEYKDIKLREQDWDWAPILHIDDAQPTVDAWLHSVETGEIYQIEHRVRMKDGSYRWHLSRGIPMIDENGKILRWFGTATDIHDLKQAEEQLKIYASRLEKSNRELEQFAFMASHDLQEPLRKIEMFGDLLLERAASLQDNERMYLNRMRNAASRMRAMIEGLLQISRVATEGKPFVQVDMAHVAREAISDVEDQIRDSKGTVQVEDLPVVIGDPLQLRQLMQNLIGNALKYHQLGKPPEVRIFAEQLQDRVQICVQDKGIGFPQEDADRIFEPFQRLVSHNQYQGSGIGLAICQRIIERHGGEIAAISEPGQGTTFIITLPTPPAKKSKGVS